MQACQTQTTSKAANELKTDKGATKVLKSPLCGPYFTKSNDWKGLIYVVQHY